MYLSRIKLNTTLRETIKSLAAPNLIHGAIENCEKCEKDERTRKLWRIDTLGGEKYLLILSHSQLDFSDVANQFAGCNIYESKCYDNLLERVTTGSKWQFRLRANPTVQKCTKSDGRGKVLAHITTTHQEEWLLKQSQKYGFTLSEGEWLVTGSQWYIFRKNKAEKNKVRMLAVTYEGSLTVTDADLFRKALTEGIGREKAFGMGLLTIAGIR